MKKIRLIQWLALLLAGALLLGFAACQRVDNNPTEPFETTTDPIEFTTTEAPTTPVITQPGFWSIEIRGVPNVTTFNSQDAQYLPKVQVEMAFTNIETGRADKVTYGGITLRSLLSFCGVQFVSSVTVSSISGVSTVYNPVMAMAEDTILAWEVDGALIDDDVPLRMCPKSGTAEMLIRQVSSINVIAGIPETTTATTTLPSYATPPMGHTNDYSYTTTTRPTTWGTYPSSVTGVEPPTGPPQTDASGNTIATTTAASNASRTTAAGQQHTTAYVYTQPTTTTRTTTTVSTRITSPKPDWWPDDVEWLG